LQGVPALERLVVTPLRQRHLALEGALPVEVVALAGIARRPIAALLRVIQRALRNHHVLICALELGQILGIGRTGRHREKHKQQQYASHHVLTGASGAGSRASRCRIFS